MNSNLPTSLQNWQAPPSPKRQVLSGKVCILQPLTVAHAAPLFGVFSNNHAEDNWKYLPYGPFSSLSGFSDWVADCAASTDTHFYCISFLDNDGVATPVGVASYLRIKPASGSIEVGHIHYSSLLQNTRAATEAMYLMMAHAFSLGYRRYEWKCNAENEASKRAAARLGFTYEGTFRQAAVVKGRNRDTAWFSIIDAEWPLLESGYTQWISDSNFDEKGAQMQRLADCLALGNS